MRNQPRALPPMDGGGLLDDLANGATPDPTRRPLIASAPARHPSEWLHPRRQKNALLLANYAANFGRKVYLGYSYPDQGYDHVASVTELESWAIDRAADDLFELGLVDVRLCGPGYVVELLREPEAVYAALHYPRPDVRTTVKTHNGSNGHAHFNGPHRPAIANAPLRRRRGTG